MKTLRQQLFGSAFENYVGASDYKWKIKVADGKRIRLNFEEFDTEPKIDQVYIFSDYGTESTILAIFSGHEIPPEITSWYDHVLIWFVSDEKVNHQGWKLRFKEID